jgi:hypothetical protein
MCLQGKLLKNIERDVPSYREIRFETTYSDKHLNQDSAYFLKYQAESIGRISFWKHRMFRQYSIYLSLYLKI